MRSGNFPEGWALFDLKDGKLTRRVGMPPASSGESAKDGGIALPPRGNAPRFEPHSRVRSLPLFLSSLSNACHILLLKNVHGAEITRSVCFTHHRGYGKTRAAFPGVESGKPLSFARFSDDLPLIPRIGVDFPSLRSILAHPSGTLQRIPDPHRVIPGG